VEGGQRWTIVPARWASAQGHNPRRITAQASARQVPHNTSDILSVPQPFQPQETPVEIVEIREKTLPISSSICNAYIGFSKMTLSMMAAITDVVRDGKPVVGYGFNSNGRYGQGTLMRERFIPRVLEAAPESRVDARCNNLDPHKVWQAMFTNEKPGGHGERSVPIGTIDMAVWDAVVKIEGKPLFQLLAERYGNGQANRQVFVYAAGGYYHPG
jgi:L-alanine-DL-glutamate epimerase-like enolase superfamily enzyme